MARGSPERPSLRMQQKAYGNQRRPTASACTTQVVFDDSPMSYTGFEACGRPSRCLMGTFFCIYILHGRCLKAGRDKVGSGRQLQVEGNPLCNMNTILYSTKTQSLSSVIRSAPLPSSKLDSVMCFMICSTVVHVEGQRLHSVRHLTRLCHLNDQCSRMDMRFP